MQALFLAIAVVIYGILWALQPESTRLSVVLLYTFCLCNFTAIGLECLNFLYAERSPLTFWLGFVSVLIVLTSVTVPATAAILFYGMKRPGGPFLNYLGANWKFAAVATIAFGIAGQIYEVMKFELERRNKELREKVEQDAAEREGQERELERAREMQLALIPKEIPQIERFEIAGTWEPARVIGGDYFDVIPLDEYWINGGQYAGGIDPIMWKWNFTSGCKVAPYAAIVGGALFSNHNLPPGDTSQINFTSGAEIGAQIFRKGTNSWNVAVKAYHLSNASIGNKNPGLNANLQFMLGYTWH